MTSSVIPANPHKPTMLASKPIVRCRPRYSPVARRPLRNARARGNRRPNGTKAYDVPARPPERGRVPMEPVPAKAKGHCDGEEEYDCKTGLTNVTLELREVASEHVPERAEHTRP